MVCVLLEQLWSSHKKRPGALKDAGQSAYKTSFGRKNTMIGISLDMTPAKGYLLAYFRNALVFEPYTIENGCLVFPGCEAYQDAVPKECHLFDFSGHIHLLSV